MNEVEKMYRNADVETLSYCCDGTHGEPTKRCKGCLDYREIYPPFTAEKQIAIIKWLADTDNYIKEICRLIDTRKYCIETVCENISIANNFEEALAGVINKIWQDLTEAEQNEIREILK